MRGPLGGESAPIVADCPAGPSRSGAPSARQARSPPNRDSRREAILDAAQEIFLTHGYAQASMLVIAARAGGSKARLYCYFKNKQALFTAYIRRHCAWQREAMLDLSPTPGDAHAALTAWGRAHLSVVLSDFSLRNFRLIVAEAQRSPEIGAAFYQAGPRAQTRHLAVVLEKVGLGRLAITDPMRAADQFIGLCQDRYMGARLYSAVPEPSLEEIAREVEAAAEVFLAAYARALA